MRYISVGLDPVQELGGVPGVPQLLQLGRRRQPAIGGNPRLEFVILAIPRLNFVFELQRKPHPNNHKTFLAALLTYLPLTANLVLDDVHDHDSTAAGGASSSTHCASGLLRGES